MVAVSAFAGQLLAGLAELGLQVGQALLGQRAGGLSGRVGAFRRGEGRIEFAQREIHFGERMPGLERIGRRARGARQLHERRVAFAQRIVGGRVFDQGLELVGGHA